jgi:hypothetical protein
MSKSTAVNAIFWWIHCGVPVNGCKGWTINRPGLCSASHKIITKPPTAKIPIRIQAAGKAKVPAVYRMMMAIQTDHAAS